MRAHAARADARTPHSLRCRACTELEESNECLGEQLSATSESLIVANAKIVKLEASVQTLKDKISSGAGRPRGHGGRDILEEKWHVYSKDARRKAMMRHINDICAALNTAGCIDWLPSAFVIALKQVGLFDELLQTKAFANERLKLVQDLSKVLAAEWGPQLAVFCRSELTLSRRDYDKLRLSFCKRYDASSGWVERVWYRCPVTGATVSMPEPLVSNCKWLPHWKALVAEHGLAVSADGKVAERCFTRTVSDMISRERDNLIDPALGWTCVFGVDGTAISGKRSFSHALVSIAPMYKQNKAVITEMKGTTLCIGQHKDDNKGLHEMLHAKKHAPGKEGSGVTSLASEIEALVACKKIQVGDVCQPCEVKGCFDLAAVRGLTATRGKASPLCDCIGKEGRQRLPGDTVVPSVPPGESLAVWQAVERILKKHCGYKSAAMCAASLHEATHVPPASWDFSKLGPFKCRHCAKAAGVKEVVVWTSWQEVADAKEAHAKLEERAADDKEAKKELDGILERHADTHLKRVFLSGIVLDVDSGFFVIDPLHCLELNVAKTAFKYSFLDKMNDSIREKVTAYLADIGIYLDLRVKGQRNPEQKWMTGATVDDYVLGKQRDMKSKSPGLAVNTQTMCELVYAPLAADASDPAPEPAAPAAPVRSAPASRRRRQAPSGGFSTGAMPEENEATITEEAELEELLSSILGSPDDSASLVDFLRKRYGNRAANVLDVMKLWEAYGDVFSAWREEWQENTPEYRAKRALRFLRASIEFSKALNKVSNYKHQSWYVHYLVWIVPRQIFEVGDMWRYSTCAIESRKAAALLPPADPHTDRARACSQAARGSSASAERSSPGASWDRRCTTISTGAPASRSGAHRDTTAPPCCR